MKLTPFHLERFYDTYEFKVKTNISGSCGAETTVSDILDMAIKNNIIEKAGAWFSFENEKIGQGRENVRQYLKDNPKALHKMEKEIRSKEGIA